MSTKKKTSTKTAVAAPKTQPKERVAKIADPGFFDKPGTKVFYIAVGLIAVLAFIIFKDFLLFNKIYLYKDVGDDSINQFYPFMMEASREFKTYGSLSWTFNLGMGQNFNSFAFYDPFDVFLYILTPSKMVWLLGYKEYFKIVLTGALFYTFLRTAGRSKYSSMIGAMMYSFCGFMIVGSSGWYFLSFDAFNIVLLLLAFELYFKKNNLWLFPLPIFLIGISRPFNLVLYTIFLVVYAIFRYYQENRKGYKGLLIIFLNLLVIGLIGLALSAPVLIDQLQAMIESPRATGPNSCFDVLSSSPMFRFDPPQFGTGINRFFCSDILGSGSSYKGWNNIMEAPQFYCGIPCLLLTPLVFGYLSRTQKKLFGIVLGFWLLPFVFPYFRYALWMFTGNYYRTYSVFVSLIFIVFSTIALDKLIEVRKVNILLLAGTTIGLLILQALPYFDDPNPVNSNLAMIARIFTITYAGIIFWFTIQKDSLVPVFVFLGLLAIELTWFSNITVNRPTPDRTTNITAAEMKERTGYNDYTKDALEFIKSKDTSFYRIDKYYYSSPALHGSLNEAMDYDYKGTSEYTSFNQKYYLEYLRTYRVVRAEVEEDSRWPAGLTGRPILQTLNSVKYIMAKPAIFAEPLWKITMDSIGKFGDVLVLKNKFLLPFGYSYDTYIKTSEFSKLSNVQKDIISLRAAVVNDSVLGRVRGMKELTSKDSINEALFNGDVYKKWRDSLAKDSMVVSTFTRDHFAGKINLRSNKIVYLSIPYDLFWYPVVDGKPYKPLLIANGMMGFAPGPGEHKIELTYKPPYRTEGKWVAISSLLIWMGFISFGFFGKKKNEEGKEA